MKKLSVKHICGKGRAFNIENYEILVDGKKIDSNGLLSINLDMKTYERAKVILEYYPEDVELDINECQHGSHINKVKPFEVNGFKLGGAEHCYKLDLPRCGHSSWLYDESKRYTLTADNIEELYKRVIEPHYESIGIEEKTTDVLEYSFGKTLLVSYKTHGFYYKDKYKTGDTLLVKDGIIIDIKKPSES